MSATVADKLLSRHRQPTRRYGSAAEIIIDVELGVSYAQQIESTGFFINVTTVLFLSGM